MIISGIALSLFIGLVGVTLLGGRLRRFVPSEQLSAESKDAVKLALGLVATMTAILLGLLISSSKGAFDTARTEVMQMAAKVALLDRVLKLYGPEAMDARHALRDATADGVRRTWPAGRSYPARLDPNEQAGDAVYAAISHLALRSFDNPGARLPICRHYPNSERPDGKHVGTSSQRHLNAGCVQLLILFIARGC